MYIQKAVILDSAAVGRSLMRISHEIIESAEGEKSVCIIGIRRRGVPLARRIAENIRKFSDIDVQVGELDISLYRDDLSETGSQANLNGTDVGFPVEGRTVVLVDDVIFTGINGCGSQTENRKDQAISCGFFKEIAEEPIIRAKVPSPTCYGVCFINYHQSNTAAAEK